MATKINKKFPYTACGFTLSEVMLSISIMLMLSATSFYYFSKGESSHALEKDRQGLIAVLEEARSLTIASKKALSYGVQIETDAAYLFEGISYTAGNSTNKIFRFNPKIHASNINLTSGSSVVFSRLTGEAAITGTITLSLISDSGVFKTITILNTGVIQ
ncbi:MAG: prepilin-type N-terminal cleavage/methylation domain-containing protein [Patescibacteria group bacterium]